MSFKSEPEEIHFWVLKIDFPLKLIAMKNTAFNLRTVLVAAAIFCFSVLNAQKLAVSSDLFRAATGKYGLHSELAIHPKWCLTSSLEWMNFSHKTTAPYLLLVLGWAESKQTITGWQGSFGLKMYPNGSSKRQAGFNIESMLSFGRVHSDRRERLAWLFASEEKTWEKTVFQRVGAVCQIGYRMNFGHFFFNPTVGSSISSCTQKGKTDFGGEPLPASKLPDYLNGISATFGLNTGFSF